ncbi:MAG TPA: cytochrome c oxidase subunit I [Bryobacteraceae bacterium]|nr:cytochrome c oxidase subunit I [Bryobacteraceae bacterium]HPQ16951.1 cytochrome c oxidase subunit I [Bryobacteraceae bacterium]HPU74092.1 cytochrome c oxidase subunit I [Bryobacteraceae bacterium]
MADVMALKPGVGGQAAPNYLTASRGLKSWLFTLDHKRIGVMYLASVLAAFLIGGVFAMLIRMELLTPGPTLMSAEAYNKAFTLHGVVMIFLFIIPSIPAALGNFALPLMLGAKDVAFPRLNLASYWLYLAGALMGVVAMVSGGIDTGWTFYTPYSSSTGGAVSLMTLAAFVLGFSSIFTGINFIATIHKLRAPGMTWFRMPLFAWSMYATAIIQILATPVIGITLLLLVMERVFNVGIFDPKLGGDPVLFQHFFWFYSHPAVYIMILPGMAVISEVIPCFSKKPIFGYKAVAYSSVAIALVSFLVWGHHMYVSGQTPVASAIFSFLTFLVAIPSAVKVFNWLATMYRGSISFQAPMLYAIAFLLLFAIGGLTGIVLGTLSVDVHLHDTYFVVAHFHYVMMGGTVIAFLAGLHYWWPKMFGRMYSEKWARISAALVFVGFNLTFFAQFLVGSRGMPRRYYNYLEEFQPLHIVSTVGSWVLAAGFFLMAGYLYASLRKPIDAPANPWGATGLEWQTSSPPSVHNFDHVPVVTTEAYAYATETEETTVGAR